MSTETSIDTGCIAIKPGIEESTVEADTTADTMAFEAEGDTRIRSDADVACAARKMLQWISYWNKDAVHVQVKHGCITLCGEVDRPYQRLAVGSAMEFVQGAKGVKNQLSVSANPMVHLAQLESTLNSLDSVKGQAS